ncbi:MAG: GlxA family transcriptional regulator [Rubrimonas sp.]
MSNSSAASAPPLLTGPTPAEPRRFVFTLTPDFTMIAFASAIEPLRLANRLSGAGLYDWSLMSETGGPVACSNGTAMIPNGPLGDVPRGATVIVCGGIDVHKAATRPLLTWLRRQARRGVRMGAICNGAHILARAGLLDGRRCTIHWDNRISFAEEFPEIEVTTRLYELDGDRMTCAGGAAAADMMVALIAAEHGPALARLVADQMIMAPLRSEADEQRLSATARIGARHPKLVAIIKRMEESLEEPVSPPDLAAEAGMSTRQLERLFRRYLNKSPKRHYMELRLEKARGLLLQTDMSVIDVAIASGFSSPSHFSKCYRAQFGRTPYRERGAPGA